MKKKDHFKNSVVQSILRNTICANMEVRKIYLHHLFYAIRYQF